MSMHPTSLSITEMLTALRDRAVSAAELVDAHLDRIAAYESLNAVVTLDADRARERAKEIDAARARGERLGPLAGVPFTLKDMHQTKGLRTCSGMEALADNVPKVDSAAPERLRAAGAILLGKTNMAMNVESDNTLFGRPINPYARARTAGGSSGGAAAAVAARLSPFDVGTDISGSIRMPAHFCGVFGLKPTLHRNSASGTLYSADQSGRPDRWLGVCGPIARSAEDIGLVMKVLAGEHRGDGEVPPLPFGDVPRLEPRELRLKMTPVVDGIPSSNAVSGALEKLAADLRSAGANVEEVQSPVPFEELRAAFRKLLAIAISAMMGADAPPGASSFETSVSARDLVLSLEERERMMTSLHDFLDGYDGWLRPAAPTEAFLHRPLGEPIVIDDEEHSSQVVDRHCMMATYTGCPALVAPVALADGLPIGVEIMGKRWRDERVLGVGRAIAGVAGPLPPPALAIA